MATDGPGVLKAQFIYWNEVASPALQNLCPKPSTQSVGAGLVATDIVVSLAGKVVESLIDAAAAKTQPEATVLEVTVPLSGFYDEKGNIAVSDGCLVFHNSDSADPNGGSILGSFILLPSFDQTAFRFQVYAWKFSRFLQPETTSWFQRNGIRDFVLKIEFLTPSSAGLGTRSVFVEYPFLAVSSSSLQTAFKNGDDLAWFATPAKPSGLPVPQLSGDPKARFMPLNVRITVVETTKPNQFAQWFQDIAKEKKSDISAAVKDAVKKSIDENYAATEGAKQAEAAATAYDAYKAAWDEAATQKAAKPKEPTAGADQATVDKFNAETRVWEASLSVKLRGLAAKKTLARSAFVSAELEWPGDLPALTLKE